MDSKKPALDVVKELLTNTKTASKALSSALGKPVEIVEWLDLSQLKFEPVFPDLVIHHDGTTVSFEFFVNAERAAIQMLRAWIPVMEKYDGAEQIAVWLGDALAPSELRIDSPNMKFSCRVVDIRDGFADNAELSLLEREILSRLQAVHQAHGGLFNRLLELPPEEHQKEFLRIAAGLGYSAEALRSCEE